MEPPGGGAAEVRLNPNPNPDPNPIPSRLAVGDVAVPSPSMVPSGGGAAEVRLYRRPSYGAALVELAALELAAPPRPIEVSPDPTVEEVDGDLGRRAGLYLALVQDGRVVDVARLLPYAGEAAGPEDEAEDYWRTGSNTSDDNLGASPSPPRKGRAFEYRLTSSDEERDEADENEGCALSSVDGVASSNGEGQTDGACSVWGAPWMGRAEYDWSSNSGGFWYPVKENSDKGTDNTNDGDEEEEDQTDGSSSGTDENISYVSGKDYGDGAEEEDDGEEEEDDNGEEEEDDDDADDDGEEEDDEEEDDNGEEEEDDDDADDDGEEEEEDDGTEDGDEGELQGKSVKINLRLWPGKKHVRIKIFSAIEWITTKAYRLSWMTHQQLEELSESSFKMDIVSPVAANTVFRIRDCLIDFEVYMAHAPNFDELIAAFRSSVRDIKFCKKLGGEGDCRVFKCLSQDHTFALKTLRLEEYCSMEPREVNIISSLKDSRVMEFYQAWIEPWSYKNRTMADYLFIQLQLCESTLKDLLLPENFKSSLDRWYLSEEIAKGVKTIHDACIVHRDLKPDNIFFGFDMGVRIGDFGDACIGQDELGRYGGTPNLGTEYYSAPELESADKITEKADTYSAGVMFFEILTSFRTVSGKREMLKRLRKEGVPNDSCDLVDDREGARGLVKRMTAVEPAYRSSDSEVLEYIRQSVHL